MSLSATALNHTADDPVSQAKKRKNLLAFSSLFATAEHPKYRARLASWPKTQLPSVALDLGERWRYSHSPVTCEGRMISTTILPRNPPSGPC